MRLGQKLQSSAPDSPWLFTLYSYMRDWILLADYSTMLTLPDDGGVALSLRKGSLHGGNITVPECTR